MGHYADKISGQTGTNVYQKGVMFSKGETQHKKHMAVVGHMLFKQCANILIMVKMCREKIIKTY